jgi:hypothetical protein
LLPSKGGLAIISFILVFSIFLAQPVLLASGSDSNPPASLLVSKPNLKSNSTPLAGVQAGDEVVVATDIKNNDDVHDQAALVVIEVRDSSGITVLINWQSGIIKAGSSMQAGISWTPDKGGDYELRTFAITDFDRPYVLSGISTSHVEIAEANTENLTLQFHVSKTNLSTQEDYLTSYYLINNGARTVALTVDGSIGFYESLNGKTPERMGPDLSCLWKYASEIEYPDAFLKPGQMKNLTEISSESQARREPGIYYITPFVILSVQENDRVKCIEIDGNTIALNVTAPVYEGVTLVLQTDKQVYKPGENITLDLYIDNNSDKPFKLSEIGPLISINEATSGREVNRLGYVADYFEYPTIQPHTRFNLNSTNMTWDQTTFLEDGTRIRVEPGRFLLQATFTFPYLESLENTITIQK